MRRSLLLVIAVLLIAAISALYWYSHPLPILTVATWAGPYGRAQDRAQMRPWLPTAPENFRHAFAVNDVWWRAHEAALTSRWRELVSR